MRNLESRWVRSVWFSDEANANMYSSSNCGAMPAGNLDLELPTSPEGIIEKVHEIAKTADKMQHKGKKRKADDIEEHEPGAGAEITALRPVKWHVCLKISSRGNV